MTVSLMFLCATGDATRNGVFGDGPLSERGLREAAAAGAALPPYTMAVRAPSTRCAQTAVALGLGSVVEPLLRDIDYGTWRGRRVDDVAAADPHGFSAWLTDPDAAPHGGESVRQLCRRTAHWLSSLPPDLGHTLVITEPAVVRASLVHALAAPARAFWHLDVPPLSVVSLTLHGGAWSVRLGPSLSERAANSTAAGVQPLVYVRAGQHTRAGVRRRQGHPELLGHRS